MLLCYLLCGELSTERINLFKRNFLFKRLHDGIFFHRKHAVFAGYVVYFIFIRIVENCRFNFFVHREHLKNTDATARAIRTGWRWFNIVELFAKLDFFSKFFGKRTKLALAHGLHAPLIGPGWGASLVRFPKNFEKK